jgi:ubiquinone/menaquinone biosynthesis C-methylase UbiE
MSTSRPQRLAADLADLKRCCTTFYASDWTRLLLGESLHPGGLALTGRLGALLALERNARVLDVASGPGRSAVYLAERFGWSIVAIDLADEHSTAVAAAAARAGVSDRVSFRHSDAEALPFADGAFDAVICECALCTFPAKAVACAEFFRVLRPGGRIGMSDVTRNGSLPDDLASVLAWVACIAEAQPIAGYRSLLAAAGFAVDREERHDSVLQQLVEDIRTRLLGIELVAKLQNLDLLGVDIAQAESLARSAELAVRSGILGYGLLVGTKPQSASGSCDRWGPESRAHGQQADAL